MNDLREEDSDQQGNIEHNVNELVGQIQKLKEELENVKKVCNEKHQKAYEATWVARDL